MEDPSGPPDFLAQGGGAASAPPAQSANPFRAPAVESEASPVATGATASAPPAAVPAAATDAAGGHDEQTNGATPAGGMDPDLFTTPAADSYAPAGTGTHGELLNGGGVDARINWRAQNAKELEIREQAEKKSNEQVKQTAAKWLTKFNEDRARRIAQTKKDNAAKESAAVKGPTGKTDWAKVNSMIDFTFKPPHERETERERFKAILFSAKEKNVPVKA